MAGMRENAAVLKHLQVILGNDVSNDIVRYISSIEHAEDYDEFMENIVDRSNSGHVRAYETIKYLLFGHTDNKVDNKPPQNNTSEKQGGSKQSNYASSSKKGKTRYTDIHKYQEKKKRLGRTVCDCLGQEHDFMNNCVHCGRIHCMEEGPGSCLFCGNKISLRGEEGIEITKKGKAIMKPKENKVFDDDNDYFKINAKKKDNKSVKQNMVVALDFATRRVIESSEEDVKIKERLLQESVEHLQRVQQTYKQLQRQSEQYYSECLKKENEDLINLLIKMRHKKPIGEEEDLAMEDSNMALVNYGTRVFDEEMITNTDHGVCLSMHQPYASLLVAGVKKHEGRTWPTNHRGRLWIAAAAKEPDEDEVEAVEAFYRKYYQENTLTFPKDYPTGCLLGCVFVEDCLEHEEYRKRYPNGESNSPFVLICSNPMILPIFYPIVGKHKISSNFRPTG
ncbi:unnamed protein product [Acanthoscelides obtectus]|uniref:ASCH domain-containing protein n=1 Tax=Acanthoscelides obtectus TaxID=200917 RepID=A0A9P0JR99_ACAOB|nr:unnamed protein product [Acanthoscelides obtectus]CAK1679111.1 Activating signal cointegrator 1 [Acanthoscelides obtectus]